MYHMKYVDENTGSTASSTGFKHPEFQEWCVRQNFQLHFIVFMLWNITSIGMWCSSDWNAMKICIRTSIMSPTW